MKRRSKTLTAELSSVGSVGSARDFVRDVIADLGHDVPDAVLLTSELVSNAVEHASTEIEVVVCVDDETFRVEVHDGFTMTEAFRVITETEVQTVESRARQGRGLVMVRGIAARFGVLDKGEGGKAVWFELLRARPEVPSGLARLAPSTSSSLTAGTPPELDPDRRSALTGQEFVPPHNPETSFPVQHRRAPVRASHTSLGASGVTSAAPPAKCWRPRLPLRAP